MARRREYIPEQLEELTPEWLTGVLRERGVLDGASVTAAPQTPLGDGEGFVGVLARIDLTYDTPAPGAPRSLIAKLPTPVKANRTMGELIGAYEREILFYDELAPSLPLRVPAVYYSALDRDRGSEKQEQIVGSVDKLPIWLIRRVMMPLARFIASRKKRRYVLLMEDLGRARLGDQVAGGSPEDLRAALVALARAHAAFWESPLLDGRFYLARLDASSRTRHSMFRDAREGCNRRFAHLLPQGLDRLLDWLDVHGTEVARRLHRDAPMGLIHGDFRFDNLFFEDGTEGRDPVVVIDWQLAGRGASVYDVAYLLGGALPTEVGPEAEEGLLRAYHETLTANGVKDYDYDRFLRDYGRGLMIGILIIATTDNMEMGSERGAELIDLWMERLLARARNLPLDRLL